MAAAISSAFLCPKPVSRRTPRLSGASISTASLIPSVKFSRMPTRHYKMVCKATSAAGSSHANSDENPYEVLGVSPIAGFDNMKAAYTRRRKDAERRGDEASVSKLDRAYDKIMMLQLTNRKKGVTFGSFQVPKDIKYADKLPIVPWGPRPSRSSVKDIRINMAISAVFIVWILVQRNCDWKPLQFLAFVFFYRVFEKLKAFESEVPPVINEYGEDEGRPLRMGKRVLRSLALVFGCMAVSSLEVIVTVATSILCYFMASYYR